MADHDIECWIVDEQMNVLQKCTRCDWQYLDIVDIPDPERTREIFFKQEDK
jgi:hypothetical protein